MRFQKKTFQLSLNIGILIVGMLSVAACSSQQSQAATQMPGGGTGQISEQITQVTPSVVPTKLIPTPEVVEETIPATLELAEVGELESEGYPEPGYAPPPQTAVSDGNPYPSPEVAVPPPVKTGLEATNPSTVNLATGKPQLIEFFAFW
jgi:hypothetical protein